MQHSQITRVLEALLTSDMARINFPIAICRVHTCSQGLIFRVDADSESASEEAVKLLEKYLKRYAKKAAATDTSRTHLFIAKTIHWILIISTLLYPISGLMMSIGGE